MTSYEERRALDDAVHLRVGLLIDWCAYIERQLPSMCALLAGTAGNEFDLKEWSEAEARPLSRSVKRARELACGWTPQSDSLDDLLDCLTRATALMGSRHFLVHGNRDPPDPGNGGAGVWHKRRMSAKDGHPWEALDLTIEGLDELVGQATAIWMDMQTCEREVFPQIIDGSTTWPDGRIEEHRRVIPASPRKPR